MPMEWLCQKRRHKGEMPFFQIDESCVSDLEGQGNDYYSLVLETTKL